MNVQQHDAAERAPCPEWAREVLHFWFAELDERDWWVKDTALDERIRARFAGLHEQLVGIATGDVRGPEAILAAVIVLDQFSRNLFRGSARAFAADPVARRLAREAITEGYDRDMQPAERLFLYMPFEHSEDRADQQLSVKLIASIGRDDWSRYADAHKAIIDRFGRFPHRNAALGRVSTPEEIAAMQEPMGSF